MRLTKNQILGVSLISIIVLVLLLFLIIYISSLLSAKGLISPIAATIAATQTETATPTAIATSTDTPTATILPNPTPTPEINGQEIIIGYSVEDRPLEVYQFGNGEHALMIVAGIHGGYEANTVALADQLIEKLKSKEILVPEDVTLYLLRNLNPDGYAKQLGADGRANADNVDLNRNWDANWQANWYGVNCWNQRYITAGSSAFSEPETQILAAFLLKNKIEALISYHSAALGIFPGGNGQDKKSIQLATQLALVSPYSYPPIATDCQYTGQLVDWASAQGIAAVDIELRNHSDTDLDINMKILNVFLDWLKYQSK